MQIAVKIIIFTSLISTLSCDLINEKNILIGKWESNSTILRAINPEYKETKLVFTNGHMQIDEKKIPVIYKSEKNKVTLFSRGEKLVVNIEDENKIVLFLKGIGKKIYLRK